MKKPPTFTLVLDQGTSSTKAFLFDKSNQVVHTERCCHSLHHPKPKHVESNPLDILHACYSLIIHAIEAAEKLSGNIISIGLAVQRSTFLFWNKHSKVPLTPAISWQDTRAWKESEEFASQSQKIWEVTGTPLSPHFGGPKFLHCVRKDSELLKAVMRGDVWYGPLSAFLTHNLTGVCSIDESIACRTLLFDIHSAAWSPFLLDLFQIPEKCLPPVYPTVHDFGGVLMGDEEIPLHCVIGDQQAALIGQGGADPETFAINLGTSGSVQFNTGNSVQTTSGLLSSVLFSNDNQRCYMLEGTISTCNSLFYHLEETMDIPHKEMRWNDRCIEIETSGVMIPGHAGISAPYWLDVFETVEVNLENASEDERIRAAMESIGFLIHDIFQTMRTSIKTIPPLITISGGGARTALLQFLSDVLNIPVGYTAMKDLTALGVNQLLRLQMSGEMPVTNIECADVFISRLSDSDRQKKLDRWNSALQTLLR